MANERERGALHRPVALRVEHMQSALKQHGSGAIVTERHISAPSEHHELLIARPRHALEKLANERATMLTVGNDVAKSTGNVERRQRIDIGGRAESAKRVELQRRARRFGANERVECIDQSTACQSREPSTAVKQQRQAAFSNSTSLNKVETWVPSRVNQAPNQKRKSSAPIIVVATVIKERVNNARMNLTGHLERVDKEQSSSIAHVSTAIKKQSNNER
jgi:hypothetical protein